MARVFAKAAPKIGKEKQAADFLERTLKSTNLLNDDRARIHFAAATLFDKMGRYGDAFNHGRMANEMSRRPFDTTLQSRFISERIRYFTKGRLKALPRAMHGSRKPVFIVGMPRSGTSLVEQILASHPEVSGAGELNKFSQIVATAATSEWSEGRKSPDCFDLMSMRRADELAADYLSLIHSVSTTARYVTDKMPQNFLFLGQAELLMPECHVIHCTRDARDTCLSCFLTDFNDRALIGFDLNQISSTYRDYARLMEHWKKVLSIPILDVRYEDLVADQRGQTKRLLNFLDLPWNERVMNFHETSRPVQTASREQVRKPIYSSSVRRWKNYEAFAPELKGL